MILDQQHLIDDVAHMRARITTPVMEVRDYSSRDLKVLEIGFGIDENFREYTDHCLGVLVKHINTLDNFECVNPAVWQDNQQAEHCDGLWVRLTVGKERVLYSIYQHKD